MNLCLLACLVVCFMGAWVPDVHPQGLGNNNDNRYYYYDDFQSHISLREEPFHGDAGASPLSHSTTLLLGCARIRSGPRGCTVALCVGGTHSHTCAYADANRCGGVVAGAFEDCCLAYHSHQHAARVVFRHAQGYRRQEVSGSCNLPAVIFFFPRRIKRIQAVCGNPQEKWVQDGMKRLDTRNKKLRKIHNGAWRTLRGL
ncbi:C-C motif chemokine 25 [Dugong dugon]